MTMQLHLQDVPARNGGLWIRHGYRVFQRQPLALIGLFGVFMFAAGLVLMLPGVGVILVFGSLPLLSLGFMLATHLVLQKKTPTVSLFIAPLKLTAARRRSQLLLCGGYVASVLVIGFIGELVDDGALRAFIEKLNAKDANGVADAFADPLLLWGIGLRLGLSVLLSALYWHAPALVHWGGQGPAQALFSSVLALWRNRAAFVMNGLMWALIMVVANGLPTLVLGALGLELMAPFVGLLIFFVMSTVFYASLYFSFVDCFMFGAPRDLLDEQN